MYTVLFVASNVGVAMLYSIETACITPVVCAWFDCIFGKDMATWEVLQKSLFLLMFVVEEKVLLYGKMSMAFFKRFPFLLESTLYCMWWWL